MRKRKNREELEADATEGEVATGTDKAELEAIPLEPEEGTDVEPAEALRQRDEAVTRWKRAQADYQNLKRRTQSDIEAAVKRSLQVLLEGMLSVVDHLDMALATKCESEDAKNLAIGVRMTRDQLLASLAAEGVQPIDSSTTFDPSVHEAVATDERDDLEPGTITATIRQGYTWRGQVLRFAHVRVARPGADAPADGAGE